MPRTDLCSMCSGTWPPQMSRSVSGESAIWVMWVVQERLGGPPEDEEREAGNGFVLEMETGEGRRWAWCMVGKRRKGSWDVLEEAPHLVGKAGEAKEEENICRRRGLERYRRKAAGSERLLALCNCNPVLLKWPISWVKPATTVTKMGRNGPVDLFTYQLLGCTSKKSKPYKYGCCDTYMLNRG
ncbi:hypothetical protein ACLOJK_008186 [Asimina triloba]